MRNFDRIIAGVLLLMIGIFTAANLLFHHLCAKDRGRAYRVEIERLALEIEENGLEYTDISHCRYVVGIAQYGENFYDSDRDYIIREINDRLYRFDYISQNSGERREIILAVNILLAVMSIVTTGILLYVRWKILLPFDRIKNVPYELSRGNLTMPMKENKNRFFGKFVWGINLLRENLEEQKQRELMLQREKKTMLLSLSHDIKTPLSAIKLYAKALAKGLYEDKARQGEIAENINKKADEIEEYVSQIAAASREDFLSLEVETSEFYLSDLLGNILDYYTDKLSVIDTKICAAQYSDCLIKGDFDRSVEVMQNIIENAIKYGDGHKIEIGFSEEENCRLITVKNSGCTLSDNELPHIFDSFWRGANAENIRGSGLGLYICRQLMRKMNGDIFAEINNGDMLVAVVFVMAG